MSRLFRSDMRVDVIGQYGGDSDIAHAAKVTPPDERTAADPGKLLSTMMRLRHGGPFEHGFLSLYVEAPIFVIREWQRHRHLSYNEVSARYRKLEPQFWLPDPGRPLIEGDGFHPMRPELQPGSADDLEEVTDQLTSGYEAARVEYDVLLKRGCAREVARAVLPVGTYSAMVVSGNPRAWMHFVSLRTHDPEARYVSYPQREIEDAARQVEVVLDAHWPGTMAAFREHGRVAP